MPVVKLTFVFLSDLLLTDLGPIDGHWRDLMYVLLGITAAEVAQKLAIQLVIMHHIDYFGMRL